MTLKKSAYVREIRKNHPCGGFTLIELSIALVVASMLMAGALQFYKVYMQKKIFTTTKENVQGAQEALETYLRMNRFYPCPAGVGIHRDEENFGLALNSCFKERGSFPENYEHAIFTKGRDGNSVVIGTFPFRSLGMSDRDALDGHGRLLQYAVTARLTDPFHFDQKQGAIDVLDDTGNSRVTPPGSIQFVVFSTGEDGVGGYTHNGRALNIDLGSKYVASPGGVTDTKRANCPGDLLESENCDGDAVFRDAILAFKKGDGGREITDYDDYMVYRQMDPDYNGGGMYILYAGSCPQNFIQVKLDDDIQPAGLPYLFARPEFGDDRFTGTKSLCYSPFYSTLLYLSLSQNLQERSCPPTLTQIGYGYFVSGSIYDQNGTFQVCAK